MYTTSFEPICQNPKKTFYIQIWNIVNLKEKKNFNANSYLNFLFNVASRAIADQRSIHILSSIYSLLCSFIVFHIIFSIIHFFPRFILRILFGRQHFPGSRCLSSPSYVHLQTQLDNFPHFYRLLCSRERGLKLFLNKPSLLKLTLISYIWLPLSHIQDPISCVLLQIYSRVMRMCRNSVPVLSSLAISTLFLYSANLHLILFQMTFSLHCLSFLPGSSSILERSLQFFFFFFEAELYIYLSISPSDALYSFSQFSRNPTRHVRAIRPTF